MTRSRNFEGKDGSQVVRGIPPIASPAETLPVAVSVIKAIPEIGDENANRQLLARHSLWVVIGRTANVAVGALASFVLVRLMPPAEFGRYSSVLAATQLLAIIGVFGVDQAIVREVGRRTGSPSPVPIQPVLRLMAKISGLAMLVCLILSAVLLNLLGSALISAPMSTAMMAGILLFIAIRISIQTGGEACRAVDDPMTANLFGGATLGPVATSFFLLGLTVATQFARPTWLLAIWIYWAASLIPAAWIIRRLLIADRRDPTRPELLPEIPLSMKEFVGKSIIPLFLISLVAFASSRADVLMMSFCSSPEEVAIYEAARRLTLLLTIPLGLVNMAVMTSISRLYAVGKTDELQKMLRTASAYAAIPCILACIAFLLFPGTILRILFGEEYRVAASVLRILVPGQLIFVLSGTCGLTLIHTGHARIPLLVATAAAIFVVLAGPPAIHQWGAPGLAGVMSLAIGFENATNWWLSGQVAGVWTHPLFAVASLKFSLK